ncbi:GTPase RhebL1 [Pseudopipra pipra]|uniref:GTPase RhebL1 n=1 Tax=Pseudopipra pipra TaxID=415032 RepID=UPI00313A3E0C
MEPRRAPRLRRRLAPPPPPRFGQWERGRVVVTCGRRCSGGGSAPSRRGGRVLSRRLSRPPAPRAAPPLRHRQGLVLGPPRAVGKTSLAHQFVEGKFVECYEPTVESTYNKVVVRGCCPPAPPASPATTQDEYTILPHSFIIGLHGHILVYSVTSLRSFQEVKTLHDKLYEDSVGAVPRGGQGGPHARSMPVVLVRNKADLALQSREVRTDEGKKLVESWGAFFLESSAKESQVTQGIFMKIIEEIDRVDTSYGRSTGCCLM